MKSVMFPRGLLLVFFLGAVATTSAVGAGLFTASKARAELELPTTIGPLKAARLQLALAKLDAIKMKADVEAAPYQALAQAILSEARVNPKELGDRVKINPETGDITRTASTPTKTSSSPIDSARSAR